jgi:mono/diheme cytochrome c family protein
MQLTRSARLVFPLAMIVTLIAAAPLAAAAQDAAQVKKGEAVYTAQKCSMCHQVAGKGGKAVPLDGVGAKLSADDIKHWITNPTEMTAKTKSTKKPPMPNKYGKLPAADIDALVAYMQSLK